MKDIFEIKGIITNESVFHEVYIPEEIPSRDKQITEIAKILRSALEFQKPMNILILGRTGTGKTLVSKYVLRKLKEKNEKIKTVYLSCSEYSTFYSILWGIVKSIEPDIKPTKSKDPKELLEQLVDPLTIVVLDDMNKIYSRKELNSLIFWSCRTLLNISFIYISSVDFQPRLESDTFSSFRSSTQIIYFNAYTTKELFEILKLRAIFGLKEGSWDEIILQKIAAYVAKTSGDAREAISILRRAAKIAEEKGKDKIDEEDVNEALETIEYGEWLSKIASLSPTFKEIVLSYLESEKEKGTSVSTNEAYEFYKKNSLKPISYFWFSKYTTYLMNEGLLKLERQEKRKRYFKVDVPEEFKEKIINYLKGIEK